MTKWNIEFYTTGAGHVPVRDFIDNMPAKTRAKVFHTLELVEEYGLSIGEPHIKHLEKDLWELRISALEGNYRFLVTEKQNRVILMIHAFQKKSHETPIRELRTARTRLREIR
jgi:phage-related protein